MSGKTGSSPSKSRRKQRQRQQRALDLQTALSRVSTMAAGLLDNVGPLASAAKDKLNVPSVPQDDDPS